jgi:hypothetical protein
MAYVPPRRPRHKGQDDESDARLTPRTNLVLSATGIGHAAVGIVAQAMQSMVVRGFIEHDHITEAYTRMESSRTALARILADAGLK